MCEKLWIYETVKGYLESVNTGSLKTAFVTEQVNFVLNRCSFDLLSWGFQHDYWTVALGVIAEGKVLMSVTNMVYIFF